MNDTTAEHRLVCGTCGDEIECCEFCDERGCPKAVCYGCVIVEIDQEITQIHLHGG